MGRPEKSEHERRSEVVPIRMTLAEYEHVRSMAETAGLSVSEFLRRRGCGYQVPTGAARRSTDPALVSELNRIGVNLNQIARNLNSRRQLRINPDDVLAQLEEVLLRITVGEDFEPVTDQGGDA